MTAIRNGYIPLLLAVGLVLGACKKDANTNIRRDPPSDPCANPVSGTSVASELVATGLLGPIYATAPVGDSTRLFIVEQSGAIQILRFSDFTLAAEPFLDLSGSVSCCGERGLLGLAFHPSYATNGRFFVNYTDGGGDTVVAEYALSASDPDRADPASEQVILTINQPQSNHNGGQLAFGPDGFLYIGVGDGGGAGDPLQRAQNPNFLLGSLLRIDIDATPPYGIPPDNPFVAGGGEPEIFSIGLRNPWRFSFDRSTGDLYIADVGQDQREEVNVSLASDGGGNGSNYGWDDCEGDRDFEGSCAGHAAPVLVYSHADGCSITGGYVYRGCRMPDLRGTYFYGDYCSNFVRTFRLAAGTASDQRDVTAALGLSNASNELSSFGQDGNGEIYIMMYQSGDVLRIAPGD